MEISSGIAIIGLLVALTNIMVEVLKKATWNKLPTNLLALMIGEVLSVIGGIAYFQINGMFIEWYCVAAFIVTGFMVAYAAMFGFDKLQEILQWNKKST